MTRLADKVRKYNSCFRFHLLEASLAIEISGDGCYETVRFDGTKFLKYEIDTAAGELKSVDCVVVVRDCGAEIGKEEGLYVSLPRGHGRGAKRRFEVELFVNNEDFLKFRHLADIMIRDDRYDLEFFLPFTGLDDIADFPSDDIVYDTTGMRFELARS